MNCSPFSQSSSPTANETSFNKYTLPHRPLRPHTHSYNFYFYGPRPTPTFTVVAAVKQRWMIKVKKKRQVSAASNAYGNQIQSTQTTLHKYKQNNVLLSNDMIRGYVRNGFCKEALRMYYQMQRAGIEPDKLAFISVINACGSLTDLQAGIKVHEDVIGSGYESDIFVGTALSSMYVKCGDLENARQVFDGMPERDVVSWNAIISGCSQNGHHHEALAFFSEMQAQGIKPNSITMVSVLPACTHLVALEQGKQIHGYVIRSGFESDTVGNALVDMYSKCGHINIAHRLFERMSKRNVVSWNEIIAGYSQNGQPYETFAFFDEMRVQGVKPNSITIVSVLTACSDLLALDQGKETHCYAIKSGFESDVVVINALVDMYAKCGTVNIAHNVFERMVQRNVVSWNVIITCDSQNGHLHEALASLNEMQVQGIKPNSITMINVLPVCAHLLALEQGKQIHGFVIRNGFDSDVVVGTGLVDMYAKCGSVNIAHSLFERMPKRNVVSWNAIISGYSQNGYPHEALALFNEMQVQGIKPNSVTVASVLPACSDLLAMEQGKQIHGYAIRRGFEYDVVVGTGLVDMYAKCGNVNIAHKLFKRMPKKNVVSWNAMIAGYFQNGHPHEALAFFNEMQVQGIKGNLFTMVSILSACADSLTLEQGKQSHGYAIRSGFDSDVAVATVLVDMYAKCGNVNIAHKLFERMPKRNAVSWNAIIAAYSQNGHPHEALAFFREMQVQGIRPDSITMITVLPVCADLLAVEQGKQFHGCVLRNGFESDVVVDTVLINMYAKCGHIDTAQRVFEKMSSRDVVAWNAMILGYGIHGHVEDALALFSRMQQMGTKPDHITFTGVLTACSHAGLVEEGWQYFESMKSDYGLAPKLEHYSCLVDLLGRAGHLDEAYDIIKKMPLEPHAVVWGSLLGACRIHCNIELGEEAAKHLFELEPDNAGCYVLLSNIYAEAGRWEDVAKLRTIMKEREVKKQPGYSFIEVNRKVHTFLVGDRSHPQSEKIYTMLETLYRQMKEAGYVCQTNLVLQDVEEEVKENVLCSHSEKLAISFGIINTSPGTPIHIMKNLRVCSDCHNATKFISKIVRREIISLMHKRTLKPLEEMLPACSRPMMEQSGLKQPPPPDQPLKFPRCDSANTNFCYYNNYSLSQPRHFCKTCKRYWTRGGTLHNVPVGGGCRKNKRANRTIDHACAQMNEASTSVNELNINGSAPLGRSQNANSMFYGLPAGSATTHDGIHSLSLATRLADKRALYGNDSEFLRTFFDPRSCILSPLNWLSSLNALNSFKPTFTCLNFNTNPNRTEALTRAVRDIDASFFESLPTQISEVPLPMLNSTNCDDLSPYSLSLQEGIINGNTNRYSEAN